MAKTLLILDSPGLWSAENSPTPCYSPADYLAGKNGAASSGQLIINLARSYRYLSTGYYCSLLAEARGQRILPSVRTIEDLSRKTIYGLGVKHLDRPVKRMMVAGEQPNDKLVFFSYFGYSSISGGGSLCRQLFERFPAPILRIELIRREKWEIARLALVAMHRLSNEERLNFRTGLERFLGHRWRRRNRSSPRYRYDLAVLTNPNEEFPPSDRRALARLTRVAHRMRINVELVTQRDYPRIAEYDALFIRETTAINHHTFTFATRAQEEGIPVIDDPDSILRCTNKVYLTELLGKHRIGQPKTLVVNRTTLHSAGVELGYPLVLKIPDGSFSRGVFKVDRPEDLQSIGQQLLSKSELVLAQEFLYTPYDWRIGVLRGTPLFACKYYMARKHWQIYDHSGGKTREGLWETLPIEQVPENVVATAVRATALVGDGLYGVDLKVVGDRAVVIEINDNPNIDSNVEDAVLGDALYQKVIEEFVRRIELVSPPQNAVSG